MGRKHRRRQRYSVLCALLVLLLLAGNIYCLFKVSDITQKYQAEKLANEELRQEIMRLSVAYDEVLEYAEQFEH